MSGIWIWAAAATTAGISVAFAELTLAHSVHGASFLAPGPLLQLLGRTAAAVTALSLASGLLLRVSLRRLGVSATEAVAAASLAWFVIATAYLAAPEPPEWAASTARQALVAAAAFGLLGVSFSLASHALPPNMRKATAAASISLPLILCATSLLQWRRWFAVQQGAEPAAYAAPLWALCVLALLLACWKRPRPAAAANLALGGAVAVGMLTVSTQPPTLPAAPKIAAAPPVLHVLLLTIDTLRRDALSVYGGSNATPNIDALAADSVVFNSAYSSSPWTLPSLSSILTGLPPAVHGARRLGDRPAANLDSLGRLMASAGYATAVFGRNFFFSPGGHGRALTAAFDRSWFLPAALPPLRSTQLWGAEESADLGLDASTDDLAQWTIQWTDRHREQPSFLWLHFYDPHANYTPPPEFYPGGAADPAVGATYEDEAHRRFINGELALSPGVRRWIRALYDAEVRYVDDRVGRLLDHMKQLGVYDDALIVLTSDHGEEFGEHGRLEHGHSLYEEMLAVPLIVKLPGGAPENAVGQTISSPVSNASIAATILQFAAPALEPPDALAPALTPFWTENEPREDLPVFFEGSYRSDKKEGVRWGDYKLIHSLDLESYELYRLTDDPSEQINLIREQPAEAQYGKALLDEYRRGSERLREGLGLEPAIPSLDSSQRQRLRSLGYLE